MRVDLFDQFNFRLTLTALYIFRHPFRAMPEPFGAFGWICSHTPLPQCNLFFKQLYDYTPARLTRLFPASSAFFEIYDVVSLYPHPCRFRTHDADQSADVSLKTSNSARGDPNIDAAVRQAGAGLGASCEIARAGQRGSIGDIGEFRGTYCGTAVLSKDCRTQPS